jgi:hypothetical protein
LLIHEHPRSCVAQCNARQAQQLPHCADTLRLSLHCAA